MNVGTVMTPAIVSIEAGQTVAAAAALMRRYNVGFLPIVESGLIKGVVTDRDLALNGLLSSTPPRDTPVEAMTRRGVVWCHARTSIDEATALMQNYRVRRLVVTDGQQRPVGIFTVSDLASRTEQQELAGRLLGSITTDQQRWFAEAAQEQARDEDSDQETGDDNPPPERSEKAGRIPGERSGETQSESSPP